MAIGTGTAVLGSALIGGAVSAIGAGVADTSAPGARVPPELELEQLNLIRGQLDDYYKENNRLDNTITALTARADILDRFSSGILPEKEAIASINRQNAEIAKTFGSEILGVVKDFSGTTEKTLGLVDKEAQALLSDRFGEYTDPRVERQITEGRGQLEERLARELGPGFANSEAGIRALQAFDSGATEMRYNVSTTGRSNAIAQLGSLQNIATQGGATRLAFGEFLGNQRNAAQVGLRETAALGLNAATLAANQRINAASLGKDRVQLSQIPFGTIQSFGTQDISNQTYGVLRDTQKGGINPFAQNTSRIKDSIQRNGGGTYSQVDFNNLYTDPISGAVTRR